MDPHIRSVGGKKFDFSEAPLPEPAGFGSVATIVGLQAFLVSDYKGDEEFTCSDALSRLRSFAFLKF